MDDPPEIAKLLKYILFAVLLSHLTLSQGQPLITDPPSVVPIPFYHSEDIKSDLISSFTENKDAYRHGPHKSRQSDLEPDVSRIERNKGGHQVSSELTRPIMSLGSSGSPGPPHGQRRFNGGISNHGLVSLCSIFRTFLDSRRFPRCQVSNVEPQEPSYFQRNVPTGPISSNELNNEIPNGNLHVEDQRINHHRLHQQHQERNLEDFHRLRQTNPERSNNGGSENHQHGLNSGRTLQPSTADKRYDHLEDTQINHSGEEDGDDTILEGLGQRPPPQHQDPTKISQDRTMIVVPERQCPPDHRRDPRGYCRRIVKIRTSYQQYGPPPGVVRPIPIRYYYSRIVSIPALHFFFQS